MNNFMKANGSVIACRNSTLISSLIALELRQWIVACSPQLLPKMVMAYEIISPRCTFRHSGHLAQSKMNWIARLNLAETIATIPIYTSQILGHADLSTAHMHKRWLVVSYVYNRTMSTFESLWARSCLPFGPSWTDALTTPILGFTSHGTSGRRPRMRPLVKVTLSVMQAMSIRDIAYRSISNYYRFQIDCTCILLKKKRLTVFSKIIMIIWEPVYLFFHDMENSFMRFPRGQNLHFATVLPLRGVFIIFYGMSTDHLYPTRHWVFQACRDLTLTITGGLLVACLLVSTAPFRRWRRLLYIKLTVTLLAKIHKLPPKFPSVSDLCCLWLTLSGFVRR